MLLFIISSLLALLLQPISADSENFGLLVLRPGSSLQYAGIYSQSGKLYVGDSKPLHSAVVTDCGFLLFDNGKYAAVDEDGSIKECTKEDATNSFAIRNGHLTLFNADGFEAVPKGSKYLFSTEPTSNSLGIIIRAQSLHKGYAVSDFAITNNCSSKAQVPSGLDTVVGNYSLNSHNESTSPKGVNSSVEDRASVLDNPWIFSLIAVGLAVIF